jgi:hypothetical protein
MSGHDSPRNGGWSNEELERFEDLESRKTRFDEINYMTGGTYLNTNHEKWIKWKAAQDSQNCRAGPMNQGGYPVSRLPKP